MQRPFPFNTGGADAPSVQATLPNPTTPGKRLVIEVTSNASLQTPAGFTKDREQLNNNTQYSFSKDTGVGGETAWTIATTGANGAIAGFAKEIGGLTGSPVDQVVSAGSGSNSPTRSTGTTPETQQAAEWLSAACAWSRGSGAVNSINDGSWTNSFTDALQDGAVVAETRTSKASGTNVGIALAERTVAASGTFETTATLAASSPGTAMMVTYKIAPTDVENAFGEDIATLPGAIVSNPRSLPGAVT